MSTTHDRGSYDVAELPRVAWTISTRSPNGGGSCVEAGALQDASARVAVRHSYHPHDQAIVCDRDEWAAFVAGIKRGTYDLT